MKHLLTALTVLRLLMPPGIAIYGGYVAATNNIDTGLLIIIIAILLSIDTDPK